MANLTCRTHKRRVVFFFSAKSGRLVVCHRNGDGSRCSDGILRIGGRDVEMRGF